MGEHMTTRSVGASAGWQWIMRAVNLGNSNPKAIFGGAALLLLTVMVLAFVLGLGMTTVMPGMQPGSTASFATSLLVTVPILLVMGCLMVGYIRLIHAVENGQPASATDVFGGFGDMRTSLRAIGFILLLAIVQNALILGLVGLLAPEVKEFYLQSMQFPPAGGDAQQIPALPEGFGIAMMVFWLIGLAVYAMQAIGIGQIALAGRGVFAAIGDGLGGVFRNLLPLLVLLVVVIAAAIAIAIALMLAVLLLGLLASLLGAWIAVLIGVPLYLALLIAVVVVAFGVMYHLWRDVCGDTVAPAIGDDRVEL
jgi:hypothetical protein